MVEFALILPVVLLILVGIIEFGSVYSKIISMRQGIREAGRQGSVANWGSTSSCGLTGVPGTTSDDIKKLMCQAKDQAGVGDGVRVKIVFADANVQNFTTDGTRYQLGNSIVVCAIYPVAIADRADAALPRQSLRNNEGSVQDREGFDGRG